MIRIILSLGILVLVTGCGIRDGDRFGGGSCPFKQLTFNQNGKVHLVGDKGALWGTYTIKDDVVTVSAAGGRAVLKYKGDRLTFGPEWASMECRYMSNQGAGFDWQFKQAGGVYGLILFALGVGAWFWVGRRRFYRRNVAGVEESDSFGGAVVARLLEAGTTLFGLATILLGIGMMVVSCSP